MNWTLVVEGTHIDGKVSPSSCRAHVVIENDAYVGRKGHGQFVKRGALQYLV